MLFNPFLEYHPTCKGAALQAVRQHVDLLRVWQIAHGNPSNLCFSKVTPARNSLRFSEVFHRNGALISSPFADYTCSLIPSWRVIRHVKDQLCSIWICSGFSKSLTVIISIKRIRRHTRRNWPISKPSPLKNASFGLVENVVIFCYRTCVVLLVNFAPIRVRVGVLVVCFRS